MLITTFKKFDHIFCPFEDRLFFFPHWVYMSSLYVTGHVFPSFVVSPWILYVIFLINRSFQLLWVQICPLFPVVIFFSPCGFRSLSPWLNLINDKLHFVFSNSSFHTFSKKFLGFFLHCISEDRGEISPKMVE